MRILITNDDGINAPGLEVLNALAEEVAGPGGEVWTVAPAFEQSGVAHCINYTRPTLISEFEPRVFACEGSPADCVLAGLHHVLKDTPPDLVLSGVNRGNNSAENTLYSGTVGAVIEAALQGTRAIALSQFYGPANAKADDPFEAARVHGADLIRRLVDTAIWDATPYQMFYSVNFPPVPAPDVKGSRIVAQGARPGTHFGVEPFAAPNGRQFLWIKGGPQHVPSATGTDAAVNLDGYISVTPMRADLTDHAALAALASDWT